MDENTGETDLFTKITYPEITVSYVEAEGKLDIYNAPDYLEDIKEHLSRTYTKELVLEFSKISYVASIGLRTILDLYKLMQSKGGVLKLKNVNKEVLYAFEITGFDKFLIIENDPDNTAEEGPGNGSEDAPGNASDNTSDNTSENA